jgi:hypothetical protein
MSKDGAIKAFEQFDRKMFADWLWRGFLSFYDPPPSETKRIHAFGPFGLIIRQQESIIDGLARVYEKYVPKSRKLMFRQAIGDVLREQGNNADAPLPALEDLIYLIARIKATEALDALPPAVGNGFLGERQSAILYDTLSTLGSLAPSSQVYEVVSELINSANFNDGYLFEAIKILVECRPLHVAAIILSLEHRLTKLRQITQQLGGDEWVAFCEAARDCAKHVLALRTDIGTNAAAQKLITEWTELPD